MTTFLTRRFVRSLFTLWLIFTGAFLATRMSGDPIQHLLPDGADPVAEARLRTYLGLDRPVLEQYVLAVRGVLTGEGELSFYERRDVGKIYAERIGPTLRLAAAALLLSVGVGLIVGILAALDRGRPLDVSLMSLTFLLHALPNFVLAITLILVFSFFLHLLPSNGFGGWRHYLMPVVALGLPGAAGIARFTRSAMLDVISQDYMRTARSKGLAHLSIVGKHALRNAFLPVLTLLGMQVGTLVAGSVVIETVFAWPGIGELLVNSVMRRDYPVLQYGIVIVAASVIVVNFLVDVGYAVLDPRIRVE